MALAHHLPLLAGIPHLAEGIDMGQTIEGDLMREDTDLGWCTRDQGARLLIEFVHGPRPRPRHRLIRRHHDALDTSLLVHRIEDHHQWNGRAIGVCDDALVALQGVWVDLGHHQRDIGVHAEGAAVIDDHRPRTGGDRRKGLTDRRADGEQGEIDPLKRALGELLHRIFLAREGELTSGRALRGQK